MPSSKFYASRKAAGLCPYCGANRDREGNLCKRCHERQLRYNAANRARKLAEGKCYRCFRELRWEGTKYCKECYFKRLSKNTFGSYDRAGDLMLLWDAQGGMRLGGGMKLRPAQRGGLVVKQNSDGHLALFPKV